MLGTFCVYSQNSSIDSLYRKLSRSAIDTGKVSIHLQLAEILVENDTEQATEQIQSALELSSELNFPLGTAKANQIMAQILFERREVVGALKTFDKAKNQFESLGATNEAMGILEVKVQVYYNASNYDDAITSLDTLISFFRSKADTMNLVNNLSRLAACYEEKGQFQKSIESAEEGYDLSILSKDIEGAAINLNNIGFVYRAWGKNDKALQTFKKALGLANEIEHHIMRGVFNQNIGIVHSRSGDFVQALEFYFVALDIFESINEDDRASDMLHNIGLIYKKNGEFAKAITYYQKSLESDLKNADSLGIRDSHHNIGNVYLLLNDLPKARYHLIESYEIARNSNDNCFDGEASALGSYYLKINDLDSALYYLEQELTSIEQCNNMAPAGNTCYNLGMVYLNLDNKTKAESFFSRSLASAIEAQNLEEIKDAAKELYELYKVAGNSSKALHYHELFQTTSDSLFNQENTRQLAWMDANYQLENVTDSLNRQQAEEASLFNQRIQKGRDQQQLTIIIAISILLCMVLYYLYFRKQRQLKYQEALALEKSNGFNAVMTATEEERKRIAKDLHDGVVQQMGAVQLALSRLIPSLPESQAKELANIKEMTAEAASETRELSHQMMPKVLIEMGLLPAMKEVIERTLVLQKIQVDFEDFGLQERYTNSIEIVIYRIFQELINNIIKHAKATQVNVQLIQNGARLILIVEDDGQGMDGQASTGIGLQNIQSRLSTIDGKVDYSSGPASGTVATVVIPI